MVKISIPSLFSPDWNAKSTCCGRGHSQSHKPQCDCRDTPFVCGALVFPKSRKCACKLYTHSCNKKQWLSCQGRKIKYHEAEGPLLKTSEFRNSSYKWGNRYAINSSFTKLRWFRNKPGLLLLEELIPRRILSTLIWWHPQLWCYKFVTDSGNAKWSNFPLQKQRLVVSPHLQ